MIEKVGTRSRQAMRPEDRAGIYLSKSFLRNGLEADPRVLQTKDPPKAGFEAPWRWSMISEEELVV